MVGNGGPPYPTIEWIMSSQFWSTDNQAFVKRSNQIKAIIRHIDTKMNTWFYYNLEDRRLLYLNGNTKTAH